MFTTDPNALVTQAAALGNSLETAATEMIHAALEHTKSSFTQSPLVIERLEDGDPAAHECFRYAVAKGVGAYLSLVDATIRSVHMVDAASEEPSSPITEPLQLIIVVDRRTAAIESLLAELDTALTRGYRQLMAPRADAMSSLLITMLVDTTEAASRQGAGSLLHSLHCPPVRVWAR